MDTRFGPARFKAWPLEIKPQYVIMLNSTVDHPLDLLAANQTCKDGVPLLTLVALLGTGHSSTTART